MTHHYVLGTETEMVPHCLESKRQDGPTLTASRLDRPIHHFHYNQTRRRFPQVGGEGEREGVLRK